MAYICGLVTKEERAELERRGWEIEPCPKELVSEDGDTTLESVMIYVDANVFDVMSGPDWEKGEDEDRDTYMDELSKALAACREEKKRGANESGPLAACQDCTWRGPPEQCREVKDPLSRMEPGELVPIGECPNCGALCHIGEE